MQPEKLNADKQVTRQLKETCLKSFGFERALW